MSDFEAENCNEITQNVTNLPKSKDYARLAKLVVQEGKAFIHSALECGFPQSTAIKGHKWLMSVSGAYSAAVERESSRILREVTLSGLKPLAVQRLHAEITNPKSSLGIKAIEIAGRFKETDWFVRNAEVQIGVFAGLAEPDAIDVGTYEEKPSNEL